MDFDTEEITARFVRGDSSRTDGGNGLGLAIALQAAEDHKGRMEVESEEGKGTSFKVFIPELEVKPERDRWIDEE